MRTIPLILSLSLVAPAALAAGFSLESAQIAPNGTIGHAHVFKGFGCSGDNLSPALEWKDPPAGAKSFVLLVHDPDAPTGGAGWWHWAVVDIPADIRALPLGSGAADGSKMVAGARQIVTDFGSPGWGGPCPPAGDKPHRYNFTLYALAVAKLDLPANPSPALVGFMANANSIGRATLTGIYGR